VTGQLPIIGGGMSGLFQVYAVYFNYDFGNFKIVRPCIKFGLFDCETESYMEDMDYPIQYKSGFLQQGPKDRYGDSSVVNGQIGGIYIPDEVSTSLSCLPYFYNNFKGTVFRLYNYTSDSYNRMYGAKSSSYTLKSPYFRFNVPSYKGATYITDEYFLNINIRRKGSKAFVDFYHKNSSYEFMAKCVIDDYETIVVSGSAQAKLSGSYQSWSKQVFQQDWTPYTSSSTSSGFVVTMFNKPLPIAELSEEYIFAGIVAPGVPSLDRILLDASKLKPNNEIWKACHTALTSSKLLMFQWVEFFSDALKWRELLMPLKGIRSYRTPKTWAQLLLWFLYGVKPTISDLQALIVAAKMISKGGLMDLAKQYVKGTTRYGTWHPEDTELHGLTWTGRCNARIRLTPAIQLQGAIEGLFFILRSLDVGIDFESIWEVIPYSFVLDWFVNTQDYVRWIDDHLNVDRYDIMQCVTSFKWETTIALPSQYTLQATGNLQLKCYVRSTSANLPEAPFELNFTDPSDHWLEGSALLVSRGK
jgi:hypothetical protein